MQDFREAEATGLRKQHVHDLVRVDLLTRVDVEHRGWERLTEEQLRAACAMPGGYEGGAFTAGWAHILACFAEAVAGRV